MWLRTGPEGRASPRGTGYGSASCPKFFQTELPLLMMQCGEGSILTRETHKKGEGRMDANAPQVILAAIEQLAPIRCHQSPFSGPYRNRTPSRPWPS